MAMVGFLGAAARVKRRQSDNQAVTRVKRLSFVIVQIRRSTGSNSWKAAVGNRQGEVAGNSGGVCKHFCVNGVPLIPWRPVIRAK